MNVKELIEVLKSLPNQDLEVRYDDYEQGSGFEISAIQEIYYSFRARKDCGGQIVSNHFYNLTDYADLGEDHFISEEHYNKRKTVYNKE